MNIGLINTGNELLLGITTNTHLGWIGQRLIQSGLRIQKQVTLPDGDVLVREVRTMLGENDVLIITGGLGPTSDDVTREYVSEAIGVELIHDEHAERVVRNFFNRMNKEMPEDNLKQAKVICGADVIPNPKGTAPGIYIPPRLTGDTRCAIFIIPGPPSELRPMFNEEVLPQILSLADVDDQLKIHNMKFTGIGESAFHQKIDSELQKIENLEVGYCARPGELDFRLIGQQDDINTAKELALRHFSSHCFTEGNQSLPEVVVGLLKQKGLTLVTAESCTGGRISNAITDVSGASSIFTHGFIVYANEAKQEMLGVDKETLNIHGAVSEEVVCEMAAGALQRAGADVAIAVTGIAGPTGGSEEKPVGTVWIGIALKRGDEYEVKAHHKVYPQGRDIFKQYVTQTSLNLARLAILDLAPHDM